MTDMRIEMPRTRSRNADHLAFHALVWLTYPMFFVAAIVSRLAPMGHGLMARPAVRMSIFAQARRACEASIAFTFQG